MKTKLTLRYLPILGLLVLAMASCRAPKVITTERVKSISTNKLIRNIEDNSFEYDWLSIKRISCLYEAKGKKTSFKATLKSEKDKRILLAFHKLNVPVGRLFLTPDSVKMINYLQKNFRIEGYDYLSNLINADFDFEMIQSILSNEAFSYRNDERENDYKEFVSYVDSGMYVLQSFKNRKLSKIYNRGKEDKIDRYLKKMDQNDFVVQYLYVDPVTYKIRRIVMDDRSNKRLVNIDFSDFTKIHNQLYPGNISLSFKNATSELKMKVKLSKFSLEEENNFNFKIPDRYKQVN